MAGYLTKLMGYVYDGENIAAEPLPNGVFVSIKESGVGRTDSGSDMMLRVVEKSELWGMPAVVLNVVDMGAGEIYFVENEWDVNDGEAYDETIYTQKPGTYVRMKRLLPGEQVIMSVDSTLFSALTVGQLVQPASGGTIAG